MYWYSDDRSIQFNFNRQKSGRNRAFYGHLSSPVLLSNISKYRPDRQLVWRLQFKNPNKHGLLNFSPHLQSVKQWSSTQEHVFKFHSLKVEQKTCEANIAGESSLFILRVMSKLSASSGSS